MLAVVLALLAAAALALVIYFLLKGNNMSVHIGGRGPGNLDRIPLKPTGLGGNTSGITAPTLTLATSPGASPASWNVAGDSTFVPGMFVHQQFATNSGFTTGVTDYLTQIQGSDWEANSSTIGNGLVTFVQPTGTYFQRARFETAPSDSTNNAVSPWSNTQTDTIVSTTTTLDSSKRNTNNAIIGNSALFGTNLKLTGVNQGAPQSAGTTNEVPVGGKYYSEVKVSALNATVASSEITLGIADDSFAFASSFLTAANSGHGAGLDTNGYAYPSTAFHFATSTAVNDVLQMCVKRTSSTAIIIWIGRNGTWLNGDPSAETGGDAYTLKDSGGGSTGPFHCWGYVSVNRDVDQADCNFGQSSFTYTKPTGATAWL